MAAGIDPIYCKAPIVKWCATTTAIVGATANTVLDGSGTEGSDLFTIFTAGTNGGFVQKIHCKAGVSANATTATALRVFINNGSTIGTAINNIFWDDLTLPATNPGIAAQSPTFELQMNLALPAGYKIFVKSATASANGWQVCAVGGDY